MKSFLRFFCKALVERYLPKQ